MLALLVTEVRLAADPMRTGDKDAELKPANNWIRIEAGPIPNIAVEAVPMTFVIVPLLMRNGVALVFVKFIRPCASRLAVARTPTLRVRKSFFINIQIELRRF